MTSAALSRANVRLRSRSDAVSFSSRPALAERRTRLESSSAVRAPESSSLGSTPTARSTPLALPLSTATAGRKIMVKATWNGITSLAAWIGTASAKFFGTSSPRIIDSTVAIPMPSTAETGMTTASGIAQDRKTGRRRFEIAGSIV
ncbi:hypothetical protein RKD05_000230 [Microbacterium sp. SLBN-111]